MKKLIFMGVLGLFLLGSCNSKSEHDHEGHSHETEKAHNHDHEGHDHEHEEHDHASENHEGHNHEAEMAAGHSDEIILAPEKAKAAGVESEIIQPKSFRQVITTSGQVQAAQGDESVVVANVAGVVSFRHPVTDGMSVSKGAPILNISAENMPDGDPVKRTRIAYETAKKEYERAAKLVKSQIYHRKISMPLRRVMKMHYWHTRLFQRTRPRQVCPLQLL